MQDPGVLKVRVDRVSRSYDYMFVETKHNRTTVDSVNKHDIGLN